MKRITSLLAGECATLVVVLAAPVFAQTPGPLPAAPKGFDKKRPVWKNDLYLICQMLFRDKK